MGCWWDGYRPTFVDGDEPASPAGRRPFLPRRLRAGPHDREILRLALPTFVALLAEPAYLLADTAVVGHLGTTQLAGLAVATSVILFGYAAFIFLAYGTTSAVARLLGAGHQAQAANQAVQGLWLAAALGVGVGGIAALASEPLLRLLGADGAVLREGLIYLRVSLLGFPSLLVVLAGTGYLRGVRDTRTPVVVAVGTAVLNLGLELLLVVGFGLGIGAAAAATVLAQTMAAGVYVGRVRSAVRRHGVGLRPDRAAMAALARVGRDLFVRTIALRGGLTVGTAVAARIGTTELAGYQIGQQVWGASTYALDALAIAGQTIVAGHLGADRADDARAVGRRMNGLSVVFGVVLGGLLLAARHPIAGLFTNDPDVVAVAASSLFAVAVLQPVNGLAFSLDGILIGAGDVAFLARAMVASSAVFVAAAAAVWAFDLGLGWLWASLGLFMATRAIVLQARFSRGAWVRQGGR